MITRPIIGRNVRTLKEMTLEELIKFETWLEWALRKQKALGEPTEELEKGLAEVEQAIESLVKNNETTD